MRHEPPHGGVRGLFLAWSPDETIRAAEISIAHLAEHGVSNVKRITRARDLVRRAEQFNVQFDPSDRTTEIAVAEAKRTIFETYLLLRDLPNPVGSQTLKKLRQIARAPDVPLLTGDDPGRDSQAELFSAAVFRAAGFQVDIAEPDLVISPNPGRIWGAAVKRVKSNRQFAARVKKAQGQLANQHLYGFVVVNPEILLARTHAQNPATDLSRMLFEKTGDWVEYLEQDETIDRVLAVLALGSSFKLVRHNGSRWFEFRLHTHFRFVTAGDPAELSAIEELSQTMMANLKVSLSNLRVT